MWIFDVLLLILVHRSHSNTTVSTQGTFAASGNEYRALILWEYEDYVLKTVKHFKAHSLEETRNICLRECIKEYNCKSIIYKETDNTCYVSKADICSSSSHIFLHNPEYRMYDVFRETTFNGTCYMKCLLSGNGCHMCGKPNCDGELCNKCRKTCWTSIVPPNSKNIQYIWKNGDDTYFHEVFCDDNWQMVYGDNSYCKGYCGYDEMMAVPMKLKLIIEYSDKTVAESYFSSFSAYESKISVGSFESGDAENDWEAPFTNRSLVSVKYSSCRDFYYDSIKCSGYNKRYVWKTGESNLDNKFIDEIQLWVTPQ